MGAVTARYRASGFDLWPDADLVQRQLLRRLLGVKQTRYAQREFFRVRPKAEVGFGPVRMVVRMRLRDHFSIH